jgi:hypothetical protein
MHRRLFPLLALLAGLLACLPACTTAFQPPELKKEDAGALKAGLAFLDAAFRNDRDFDANAHGQGVSALAGLAMLEGGTPKDARAIKQIAERVRAGVFTNVQTYEVSLMLMFLDRLGDNADKPLIQFLGLRLLLGQQRNGIWTYSCGEAVPANEERRLRDAFAGIVTEIRTPEENLQAPKKKADTGVPVPVLPKTKSPSAMPTPSGGQSSENRPNDLHHALQEYHRIVQRTTRGAGDGDHSNTQFAIVGLWCARRNGVPVDGALKACEAHFRQCQTRDGGWGYIPSDTVAQPAMTCAGILAISLGLATNNIAQLRLNTVEIKNIGQGIELTADAAINRALARLEGFLANPGGDTNASPENYYFAWSIERVAMALSLERIGRVDWYRWGADRFRQSQDREGSWAGSIYPGATADINTAFVVLFLSRANLTKELTKSMRSQVGNSAVPEAKSGVSGVPVPVAKSDAKGEVKKEPTATTTPPLPRQTEPVAADQDARKLANRLLAANREARQALLVELRDSKGAKYTEALLMLLPDAPASLAGEARQALTSRFTRMTKNTLKDYLKDINAEARRAAALAIGLKADAELASDLVAVLADGEDAVVQAARESLKTLYPGNDHGPASGANATAKARAIQEWRNTIRK